MKTSRLVCILCGNSVTSYIHSCIGAGWEKYYGRFSVYYHRKKINSLKDLRKQQPWVGADRMFPRQHTPSVSLPHLGNRHSATVLLKNEGLNQTGSFKDQGARLSAYYAVKKGFSGISTVSSGNQGSSIAYFSRIAGLQSLVFSPRSISPEKQRKILDAGGVLYLESGSYETVYRKFVDSLPTRSGNFYPAIPATDPFGCEGSREIAFELVEDGIIPDIVVVPSGNGSNLAGIWQGFRELQNAGLIEYAPQMVCVQIQGSDPIARGFREKKFDEPCRVMRPRESIAEGIVASESYDYLKAVRALEESSGVGVSVTERELVGAYKNALNVEPRLKSCLFEPTSWSVFAALEKICIRDKRVVLVGTGSASNALSSVRKALGSIYM